MPDIRQYPTTHLGMANDLMGQMFGLRAGPEAGTAVTPSPTTPARPTVTQSEADIRRGHAQRRELLARRRAEQQVAILMAESQRLGLTLAVDQIVAVAIDTYLACKAVARR